MFDTKKVLLIAGIIISLLSACRKPEALPDTAYDERMSGGVNTVFDAGSRAFSNVFPGLSGYDLHVHELGDNAFSFTFVTAPAPVNAGLGPVFNNVSCISCHHNDGIGLPTVGDPQSSLLLRIGIPGTDEHGGPLPAPGYGGQLQDKAVYGVQPECNIDITYAYQSYSLADGTTYQLRTPTYSLRNMYSPISGYLLSPRLAPPVFGLGLLEAIPESAIVANADPNDKNNDGIKGIPNYVWDPVSKSMQLGRFGWKANTANLLTQVATAANQDMGVNNSLLKEESCYGQPQWNGLKEGTIDLPDSLLNAIKFYVQTLAVPGRRNVTDSVVKRGKQIFADINCTGCHTTTFTTGVNEAFPLLSNQTIHPYTDMLVHDMGPGLADGRPDFAANGQQWRTAPLWGIGLFSTVNYPAYYLHDGRARSLLEAIMWHDGEAKQSKTKVQQLSTTDRNALMTFLQNL